MTHLWHTLHAIIVARDRPASGAAITVIGGTAGMPHAHSANKASSSEMIGTSSAPISIAHLLDGFGILDGPDMLSAS